ncbi:MAG TPA: OsmC family peroxiredoxin [Acidimicrobiia bacterium]|nr:OsmC family peroxiredoxin [Acidimicrobiia bacterium]
MESRAHAVWNGNLAEGSGEATLASGVAGPLPMSWPSRTEAPAGKTSPEELIAAAHAACYSMALSGGLARAGTPPTTLETDAVATFEKTEPGWRLTRMALSVVGEVAGIDDAAFQTAAAAAKDGCPVSNALKGNVEIIIEAALR